MNTPCYTLLCCALLHRYAIFVFLYLELFCVARLYELQNPFFCLVGWEIRVHSRSTGSKNYYG